MIAKDQITSDDIMFLGLTNTPWWIDGCGHGEESYLFSFTHTFISNDDEEDILTDKIDVYSYESSSLPTEPQRDIEFCLRYGNRHDNYWSPGNIIKILELKSIEKKYDTLCQLLLRFGTTTWTAKMSKWALDIEKLIPF